MSNENETVSEFEKKRKLSFFLRLDKAAKLLSTAEILLFFVPTAFLIVEIYEYISRRELILSGRVELIPQLPLSVLIFPSVAFLQLVYFTLTGKSILVDIAFSIIIRKKFASNDGIGQGSNQDFYPSNNFRKYVERSKDTLKSAQRRPNTLMLIGAVVAVSGLIFFVATLPEFSKVSALELKISELEAGSAGSERTLESQINVVEEIIKLLPRLLMLIFIQLLAGFFLRQYRTSMEEVRYYEAILRSREDQMLVYCMVKDLGEEKKKIIIDSLSGKDGRDIMKLQQGESTITIETYRADENEFKGPIEKLIDVFISSKK